MVIMTPVLPTSELILRFYQIVIVAIPVVTKVSLRPLNVYVQGVLGNSEIRLNNCQNLGGKTGHLVCEIVCVLFLARCLKQLSMIMKGTL